MTPYEKAFERVVWQNEPSILTPLNETNLNKMDYSLNVIDDRVVALSSIKADEDEVLQLLESVTYNSNTGVFTFTWKNGSTYSVDLNIEKIPVSFSMSPQGVITMTTSDGTQYTADVGALIKLYTFVDSSEIDFTVTTDASGNKTITASIVAGSITGDKLQPNFLADCQAAKAAAELAASSADADALVSEGFAVGEQNGVPVPSTSPYYHNNAKWYSEQAELSEKLLDEGDITILANTSGGVGFSVSEVIPNNPTFAVVTDTDYDVVESISWNPHNRMFNMWVYNPLNTDLTVKYKVYYKTV